MSINEIPSDYLTALGKISINHNNLEFSIIYCIKCLIRKRYDETLCLIAGENFDILLKKLTRLMNYYIKTDSLLKQYEQLKTSINNLNEKKTHCLHAIWKIDDDQNVTFFKHSKRFDTKFTFNPTIVKLETLNEIGNELLTIADQLIFFISENIDKIHIEYDRWLEEDDQKIIYPKEKK